MALEIKDLRRQAQGLHWISPARLCVSADDEVVECTDPKARKLLVGEGGTLPLAVAERYGLVSESKAKKGASNKAQKGTENKAEAEPGEE